MYMNRLGQNAKEEDGMCVREMEREEKGECEKDNQLMILICSASKYFFRFLIGVPVFTGQKKHS